MDSLVGQFGDSFDGGDRALMDLPITVKVLAESLEHSALRQDNL
jgi:hypothetical protein